MSEGAGNGALLFYRTKPDAAENDFVPHSPQAYACSEESIMSNEQKAQDQQPRQGQEQAQQQNQGAAQQAEQGNEAKATDVDGLKDKKPEELTPDELRLMADTMPGEGPGD
jgi:hypothetical protein